jgi:NADPH:quinone reductase-like Zn-dependent oxidoreductase
MKAIQIYAYGGNEVVVLRSDVPKPVVSAGKLLIKMHAASVNPVDWKIRAGYLQNMRPILFPFTLGMDFSGVVIETGQGVSTFKPGDAVYGMAGVFSGDTGTFSEFICADAAVTSLKPKNIDFSAAAALPMAGVSAWQALVDYMGLSKGQKVLIHGGTGGIGMFAIQVAKYLGAYVATTVSGINKKLAKELGADEVIDYKEQSFENLLKNYDAVLDTIGGETYVKSFQVLRKGGVIVSMLENPNDELIQRYGVRSILEFTETNSDRLSKLAALVENTTIKIHITKVFPFQETSKALDYVQNHHPAGKVIIEGEKQ